ncbi:MAG: YggS family pyridoxal phosphate-dependent enzyme [Salinisphaeraceae bacterium]|nr:YggS family pyridoxal phosphate-dependent enzyme [Salinisphaeraceae bacterium]
MTDLSHRLGRVRDALGEACDHAGRARDSVTLMAVSKTRPADAVRAAAAAGQRDFGENYLQEALEKISALRGEPLVWHFIGPIQSNKTRDIASHFDWVHSVDRLKIARRLSSQRPEDRPPLNICLQVNISGEASKSGVAPAEAAALAGEIARLPGLRLRGLMAIPEPDSATPGAPFAALRELQAEIARGLGASGELDTLSMGMSDDFPAAIAEGATIVRIGTAIFGPRE